MSIVQSIGERFGVGGVDRAKLLEALDREAPAVTSARKALVKAEEALAAEERRINEAQNEIEASSNEIAAADPDGDGKAFAKLVQRRDAARGRLEALQVRHGRATKALEDARAALAEAELKAKEAELERLDSEIKAADEGLTAATETLEAKAKAELNRMRDIANQAVRLDGEIRRAKGERDLYASVSHHRRSVWLASGGRTLLELAGNVLEQTRRR